MAKKVSGTKVLLCDILITIWLNLFELLPHVAFFLSVFKYIYVFSKLNSVLLVRLLQTTGFCEEFNPYMCIASHKWDYTVCLQK